MIASRKARPTYAAPRKRHGRHTLAATTPLGDSVHCTVRYGVCGADGDGHCNVAPREEAVGLSFYMGNYVSSYMVATPALPSFFPG